MVLRPDELEDSQCCLFQPLNPQAAAEAKEHLLPQEAQV